MYAVLKRILDITVSFILLVVLSPLLLMIMLAVAADSSGKVIFMQQRAGRMGKPFKLYKFRTMNPNAPRAIAAGRFVDASHFITPVGRFLRYSSLDELPQLFNILKGDMSFIGPRPVILAETELLDRRKKSGADQLRPGITGLAQIRGRNHLDDRTKARYDAFYAHHVSLCLDAYIAFHTVGYVLRSEGIREGAAADMEAACLPANSSEQERS